MAGIHELRPLARALPKCSACPFVRRAPHLAVRRWGWTLSGAPAGSKSYPYCRRRRLQPSHAQASRSTHSPLQPPGLPSRSPASRRRPGLEAQWKLRPDCFSLLPRLFFPQQLEQLFAAVLPHALPGAQWVISEFAIPPNAFAAYLARGIIGFLYRAFGLLTGLRVRALPDYATPLLRRGLAPTHDRRYLAGLLCSQIWTNPPAAKML